MRKLLVILGRIAGVLGLLLLVLAIGVAVITHTDRFREFAREQLVTTVNESIQGSLSVGRIEGSLWGNVILHDLAIHHQGAEIFQVPQLTISYSLIPLIWSRLHIFEVKGARPLLRLERGEDNELNIVQALAPKQPSSEEDAGLVLLLNSLVLQDGSIELRLAGPTPQHYSFTDVTLDSRLSIRPQGASIDLTRVAGRVTSPGLPELSMEGAATYRETGSTDTFEVKDLVLATGASRAKLNGKIADLKVTDVAARIVVERLAPSDAGRFVAGWPIKRDISGVIEIDGPLHALQVDLDLAAAGAKLAADLQLEFAPDTPRYRGTFSVTAFDVKALLGWDDIAGVLNAKGEASGAGFDIAGLDARGTVKLQSAVVAGWALGDVAVEGRLRQNVVQMAGNLKSKIGGASWNGQVSFKDKPAYDLTLSVKDLDIQQTSGNRVDIGGRLNFKGAVKGSGFDLAAAVARADLQILPSTIGPVDVKQGSLSARLADQQIHVSEGTLSTEDTTLAVKGSLGLDTKQSGKLDYRIRSDNLTPWLALVDQQGSGSLQLTGQASGNLAALESQGNLKFSSLRIGDNSVKSGAVDFVLRRHGAESLPEGTLRVQLGGVEAGIEIPKIDGAIGLVARQPYEIRLDLKATDHAGREHALGAQIEYSAELVLARLDQLRLNLGDGLWQLSQPATIARRGDSFDIDGLALRNRAQQLVVNGRFATSGKQDLQIDVQGFPMGGLAGFLPDGFAMTGILNVEARVNGTAAAPQIVASVNLTDTAIAGHRYDGVTGAVTYRDKSADLKLTIRQDSTHTLTATGKVPLILSWSPQWQAQAGGDMNVRIQSAGLSIAFLNAFSGEAAQNIGGNVSLDVLAQGPVNKPLLRGTAQLTDGAMTLNPLGVQVTAIAAEARLDGQTVTLQRLSARAKDGRLNGSGVLALRDYQPGNFKLTISASRWPAIQTQRYRATVAGKVDIQGSVAAPVLTGQLEVLNADLRPDLDFLSRGKTSLTRDETIVVVQSKTEGKQPVRQENKKSAAQRDNELLKTVRLDVGVTIPNQAWIRHPDASVELKGKIRAVSEAGKEAVVLTGTIEVVRGWVAFQGRRFNLVRGAVEFRGGETINPALDILAQHRLPNYQVEVAIGGTLDKPALELRSEPMLEQADILALLLFGKPLNDLSRTEQTSLQQSAVDLAGGFAAATLGTAVSEALGLDRLGLDVGELDFSGGQIGFGRYIGDRAYFSVSQELSGEAGRQVSIEYRIGPDWKIVTSTSSTGTSGIGILWQKRY